VAINDMRRINGAIVTFGLLWGQAVGYHQGSDGDWRDKALQQRVAKNVCTFL
jgi:hypothetical protein